MPDGGSSGVSPRFLKIGDVAEIMSSPCGVRDRDVMVCDTDMSSTRWMEVGS